MFSCALIRRRVPTSVHSMNSDSGPCQFFQSDAPTFDDNSPPLSTTPPSLLQHLATLRLCPLTCTAPLAWWRYLGGAALGLILTRSWPRRTDTQTPAIPCPLPASWGCCSVGETTLWLYWQETASATARHSPRPASRQVKNSWECWGTKNKKNKFAVYKTLIYWCSKSEKEHLIQSIWVMHIF